MSKIFGTGEKSVTLLRSCRHWWGSTVPISTTSTISHQLHGFHIFSLSQRKLYKPAETLTRLQNRQAGVFNMNCCTDAVRVATKWRPSVDQVATEWRPSGDRMSCAAPGWEASSAHPQLGTVESVQSLSPLVSHRPPLGRPSHRARTRMYPAEPYLAEEWGLFTK
jgi:hypothetical protein